MTFEVEQWERALSRFCTLAKAHGIDYYLIGSVSASVRGVGIRPRDIDVIIDVDHIAKTEQAFSEFLVQSICRCDDGPAGYFGTLFLDGVLFEISAQPDNRHGRHAIETLCWNGHILKAQSLELLYRVYQKSNRVDYQVLIDRFWEDMALDEQAEMSE